MAKPVPSQRDHESSPSSSSASPLAARLVEPPLDCDRFERQLSIITNAALRFEDRAQRDRLRGMDISDAQIILSVAAELSQKVEKARRAIQQERQEALVRPVPQVDSTGGLVGQAGRLVDPSPPQEFQVLSAEEQELVRLFRQNKCGDPECEGVRFVATQTALKGATTHREVADFIAEEMQRRSLAARVDPSPLALLDALLGQLASEQMQHLEAADRYDRAGDTAGNAHAELKAARICREHFEAVMTLRAALVARWEPNGFVSGFKFFWGVLWDDAWTAFGILTAALVLSAVLDFAGRFLVDLWKSL